LDFVADKEDIVFGTEFPNFSEVATGWYDNSRCNAAMKMHFQIKLADERTQPPLELAPPKTLLRVFHEVRERVQDPKSLQSG
jgi:hypothetical protein